LPRKLQRRTPDLSLEDPSKLTPSLKDGCVEWNDVPMGGILNQGKDKLSNQEPKTLNEESMAIISLFSSPRVVVETVAASSLLPVLDPGEGQLCWLIT